MDLLAEQEKKKYERLWELAEYQKDFPCFFLVPIFLNYFGALVAPKESVIDFGCGCGKSAIPLLQAGLDVRLVDFCNNSLAPEIFLLTLGPDRQVSFFQECLWELSHNVSPADWILSFDVLEHIPEAKIDSVLEAMALRMQKGGLLSISLKEDVCGKLIGEVLHLTVKPMEWWKGRLERFFIVKEELANHQDVAVFTLAPLQK
jgi:2-polyprenyl-3-methyl-5-hydroxy-6-metoxy-1,4-benzoquinol methylase